MTKAHTNIIVYHIPICPFSQRLEILLALKGRQNDVHFEVVDITKSRDKRLLKLTHGTTELPELITGDCITTMPKVRVMGHYYRAENVPLLYSNQIGGYGHGHQKINITTTPRMKN